MSKNGHKVRLGKLSEFRPQTANANKHTERGLRMLDDAMSEDGYVAPMTAVADAEIIDGSARLREHIDPSAQRIRTAAKHKYLMPLDAEMRAHVLSLAKPYPKRATSETIDTSGDQSEKGGAAPTVALQIEKADQARVVA